MAEFDVSELKAAGFDASALKAAGFDALARFNELETASARRLERALLGDAAHALRTRRSSKASPARPLPGATVAFWPLCEAPSHPATSAAHVTDGHVAILDIREGPATSALPALPTTALFSVCQ